MNDRQILAALAEAVDRGTPVVLATVVATRRSVPRHAGTKMLIYADGRGFGTIGGGAMESAVIDEAVVALRDGRTRLLEYALLDPGRGQLGLDGGGDDAGTQRLGEDQAVSGLSAPVGQHLVGVHQAGYRQAVLELLVLHRVAAHQHRPGLADLLEPALQGLLRGSVFLRTLAPHGRPCVLTPSIQRFVRKASGEFAR